MARMLFLALMLLSIVAGTTRALRTPFTSVSVRRASMTSRLQMSSTDAPPVPKVVTQEITAEILQQMVLKDQYGQPQKLGDRMGRGRSVVVFLRHLA